MILAFEEKPEWLIHPRLRRVLAEAFDLVRGTEFEEFVLPKQKRELVSADEIIKSLVRGRKNVRNR